MPLTLIDGQWTNKLPADDRGLAYGDGLFETMRVRQGRILFRNRHLQRLQHGCSRLGLSFCLDRVTGDLDQFLAEAGGSDAILKLILTRGSSQRGYAPDPRGAPRLILQLADMPVYSRSHYDSGIRLGLCTTKLGINQQLAGLKHLNRLEQVLARQELTPEYQEGVVLDAEGLVVEGVFSNLFVVKDQRLLTPQLDRCGVAGVARSVILDQANAAGTQSEETLISLEQLRSAEAIFMTNAVIGVWPVAEFQGRTYFSVEWANRAREWLDREAELNP